MNLPATSTQIDSYPFTVFVEGNVGAGKTSFLNFFKKFDEFFVMEEPIEKWKDLKGINLLDLKFNEPERFQFPFQHYATLTRLQQHLQVTEKPIKMIERSLFTGELRD
jgi:deoxynucleoside kinase